jgi:hypothetical protein
MAAENCCRRPVHRIVGIGILALVPGTGFFTAPAKSLPLYARQTGEPCATRHLPYRLSRTDAVRPPVQARRLSAQGGDWKGPPFAFFLQPGFTHTQAPQSGGAAPGFAPNNDFAMQQISGFAGGALAPHLGAFIQPDGAGCPEYDTGPRLSLYHLGLRADPDGHTLHRSSLRPAGAGPQRLHVYRRHVLFRVRRYRPLSNQTQLALGISPSGVSPISGIAPYWRVAAEKNIGNHSLEIGIFGLTGHVFPTGLSQAGTDSFTDVGVDTQYQFLGNPHMVTARVAWIHENHNTRASQLLGLAGNPDDTLQSLNASVSYIYNQTWSLTGGCTTLNGSADGSTARRPAAQTPSAGSRSSPTCRSAMAGPNSGHG